MAESTNWWKEVPCHFTWNLEDGADLDYKSVTSSLEGKLEEYAASGDSRKGALLLFYAYLPSSKLKDNHKPQKDESLRRLDEADKYIETIVDEVEKRAHVIVAVANRLWILNNGEVLGSRDELLLSKLKEEWSSFDKKTKELLAHIDAIVGFALLRLGGGNYEEGEKYYRRAIKVLMDKPKWLYDLGQHVGRKARRRANNSREFTDDMKEEQDLYERALDIDPSDSHVRCSLAQILFRLGNQKAAEAEFDKADESLFAVILEKGRFYRKMGQNDKALEILLKGEAFSHPTSELFFQISLIFSSKAHESFKRGDNVSREGFLKEELKYIEQCLEEKPSRVTVAINKAKVLENLRRNSEADELWQDLLTREDLSCYNSLEIKCEYAHRLFLRNSYKMTQEAANVCNELIDEAIEHCTQIDRAGNMIFDDECKRSVRMAQQKLMAFYTGNRVKRRELKQQLSKFGL